MLFPFFLLAFICGALGRHVAHTEGATVVFLGKHAFSTLARLCYLPLQDNNLNVGVVSHYMMYALLATTLLAGFARWYICQQPSHYTLHGLTTCKGNDG